MSERGSIRPSSSGGPRNNQITLQNGVETAKIAGPLTVAELRENAGLVGAQGDWTVRVNSVPVSDETVVNNGDTVDFVRALGGKG